VWAAAPVKVAIALVLALVQACGWPSEIWLTAQILGVTAGGWLIVLEVAVDTVVELGVLVGTGGVAEELLEDDGDEEEIGGIGEDEGVL
jgi:hypothetical protein